MSRGLLSGSLRGLLAAAALAAFVARDASADELAEFLFWNEIGNATDLAAQSYADYQSERQMWREKIAAAKAEMERCGGCASAKADLEKWQQVEEEFHAVAGGALVSTGTPPIVAQALGIKLPLAPRRSPEEWAKMCEVVRRDWIDQRPESCQAAADRHLACLRTHQQANGVCSWQWAEAPGAQCWDTSKLYAYCYSEDYESFQREQKAQQTRTAGIILPEYTRYQTSAIILYGRVPDDYLPELPPSEIVLARLAEENTQAVKFRMQKTRDGALGQITVKHLHWTDLQPESTCFGLDAPTDEIGQRHCEDLTEISFDHQFPILACSYVGGAQEIVGAAIYWYGEQPLAQVANPANLLKRSLEHPLLRIGEARSDCPPSMNDVGTLEARRHTALAALGVHQTPADVALRSEWQMKRQADNEARMIAERERKLAAFSLEGGFDLAIFSNHWINSFGIPVAGNTTQGECTLKKIDESSVQFSCKIGRKVYEAKGEISQGLITVPWEPTRKLTYAAADCGSAYCLEGKDDQGFVRHSLSRKDPAVLSMEAVASLVEQFHLEGAYDLQLSAGGATVNLRCTIRRSRSTNPNSFPTSCLTDAGEAFAYEGKVWEYRAPAKIKFPWFPSDKRGSPPLAMNGQQIADLEFPIDGAQTEGGKVSILAGQAKSGITARLMRIDQNAEHAFETPLEELPELQKGSYAGTARAKGIETLEKLAALSDGEANVLGIGWIWRRDLAREFLKARKAGAGGRNSSLKEQKSSAASTSPLPNPAAGLTGKWSGTYSCSLGPTAFELILQDFGDGSLWGTFAFSATPDNPAVESGSFYVWGINYAKSQDIELLPGPWIVQPSGYASAAMTGNYKLASANGPFVMEGRVLLSGCERFQAEWVGETTAELGEMPPAIRQKLKEHGYAPAVEQAGQGPIGKDQSAAAGECTADMAAGTYKSQFGDLVCKRDGARLECCYGGQCANLLHLDFDASAKKLTGVWEEGSNKGSAEFSLSDSCEMGDGRWAWTLDEGAANNAWDVQGKK